MERRRPDLAELGAHVVGLAARGGIDVEFSPTRRPRAFRAQPSRGRKPHIVTRPIRSQKAYLVALHELAHLLARGNASRLQLEREAHAWQWVLERAIVQPSAASAHMMLRSLDTYLLRAERRHELGYRTKARIPASESPFWATRETLRRLAE